MLWGSYNNNVFAFTSLPGSCVILPVLEVSFFTRNECPGIFIFIFYFFVLCYLLSIFVREKIFKSRPSHKRNSVFSKSITEGTHRDSCSGKTKF